MEEILDLELPYIENLNNKKIVIYGSGVVGKSAYNLLIQKYGESSIAMFVDNNSIENELYGKKIITIDDMAKRKEAKSYLYFLGTLTKQDIMTSSLKSLGIEDKNIYQFPSFFSESKLKNIKGPINKILLYPLITSEEKLNMLISKIKDYMANILKETNTILDILFELPLKYSEENICLKNAYQIEDYDIVLVWKHKALKDLELNNTRCGLGTANIFCIDDQYFTKIDCKLLTVLGYKLIPEKEKEYIKEISRKNFSKLKEMQLNSGTAFVFGLGPSLRKGIEIYREMNIKDSLRIVCNDMVLNKEVMTAIEPNLYTIIDTIWLSGYYKNTLDYIIKYIKNGWCYLAIREECIPVLLRRYGMEIQSRLIGIKYNSKQMKLISEDTLETASVSNVITSLGVPFASSLAHKIYITGCDGKALDKEGAWEYSDVSSREDIIKKLENTTVVGGLSGANNQYLIAHYNEMEKVIRFGEKLKKEYISITPSYIPALNLRCDAIADNLNTIEAAEL